MPERSLSADLQQFIVRYIRSVEQLEVLGLLASEPDKSWTAAEVFRRIQSSEESVTAILRYFTQEGFLDYDARTGHRYSPRTEEQGRLVADLIKTYRERRVTVVETIYAQPSDPIRDFADAFRFRKDKKDQP